MIVISQNLIVISQNLIVVPQNSEKKVKLVSGEVSLNKSGAGAKQLKQQLQGIKHIAAGTEVVVECVGQWQQDTDITASFFKGTKDQKGCEKSHLVFLKSARL